MRIPTVLWSAFVLLFGLPSLVFAEVPQFRIGVIIPLSGQVASLGNYVKHGIDLAFNDLPPADRARFELVYEDDEFDPAKTITAYRKLNSVKKLDAVFVVASPPANALGPIVEADKTILVAIGASDPTIAVGKSYSFIHWVIPPVLAKALSAEFVRRDLKRIAFVVAEVTGAMADADAAEAAIRDAGRGETLVYRQNFAKETTDYRSALTAIRQKRPDAVVAVVFPGALGTFARQFRAMNIPAELVGIETFEDEAEVKASGGALHGGWYVNAAANSPEFVTHYREKYGEHPGWGAGNGYDTLRLVTAGALQRGSSHEAVRDFLRSVKDYHGACGIYSSSGDNRFTLPAELKQVTPEGFVVLPGAVHLQ